MTVDTPTDTSTTPADIPTELPANKPSTEIDLDKWRRKIAHVIVNIPPYVWLMLCGLGSAVIYQYAFARRYSLQDFGGSPMQSAATMSNFSADGAFLYVFGFLALFGLYWLGLRKGLHLPKQLPDKSQWLLVGIFAVAFNGFMLMMYPMDAADIYDYIIRGRMTAQYPDMNPMVNTPNDIQGDPFYSFAASSWHGTTSAYGPTWELLAALGSRIAGDDVNTNVIVFKMISVIAYGITALLVVLILRIIAPRRALTGFYLFAWNPLVIYMTAGVGHHDTVMCMCIMLSVYCLVRRWYVGATLAALLGALVKFIPILLVPVIAVVAFRRLRGQVRIRYFVLSALLGGLLILVMYAPYGNPLSALRLESRTTMYTGSIATLARQQLGYIIDGRTGEVRDTPNTNIFLRWVVLGLLLVFYLERLDRVYREVPHKDDDPLYVVRIMTTIILFYQMVGATWFQPWYVVWVVPLAAVLDNTPMRRLILYFSYFATWQSFMYNYVTLRPSGWAAIPWRDLLPVAFVQFTAWGYVIYYWISKWLREASRQPLAIQIGDQLRTTRLAKGITPTDLADQLDLRTDDVIAYEQGEKNMRVDTARDVAAVLNINFEQLSHNPAEKPVTTQAV